MAYTETRSGNPALQAIWTMHIHTPTSHIIPADGCMDLIFHSQHDASGTLINARLFLTPPTRRADPITLTEGSRFTGLRFRPGWATSALSLDPAALTQDVILAPDLSPRFNTLLHQLAESKTPETLLQNAISRTFPTPPPRLRAALSMLGKTSLHTLTNQLGISPRTLRRDILAATGLPPKTLARIIRFQNAQRLKSQNPHLSLPELALITGYADQSHMTRDFQEFAATTPSRS